MSTVVERHEPAELVAAQQLEQAARFLDLEPWIARRLGQCERDISVNLEIIHDNGEPMLFRGIRVQHSSARGPYMGPLMFAKQFTDGQAHALAMELTWQSALWELPFGGSAGSIAASLEELSEREGRLLTRAYVEALRDVLGRDVLTPEREGHPLVNAWALSALGKVDRGTLTAVTGKPASLGGIEREKIAAMFLRSLIAAGLHEQGIGIAGAHVAIAGFGREARCIASALDCAGANIVAVSDRSGAIFHRNRLDVRALLEYVETEEVVFGYPDGQGISTEEMMRLPANVLILAAGQDLSLPTQASMVVEAGGRVNCLLRDTVVVPWLLGDAGLRLADFLEWRKTACGELAERELLRGMQGQVRKTLSNVWEYARKYEISLEQASIAIAVARVAEAIRMG